MCELLKNIYFTIYSAYFDLDLFNFPMNLFYFVYLPFFSTK